MRVSTFFPGTQQYATGTRWYASTCRLVELRINSYYLLLTVLFLLSSGLLISDVCLVRSYAVCADVFERPKKENKK